MTQGRTKSAFTSTRTLISVVSVLIYCAGFVRVEIKLNEQEERMSEMEKLLRVKDPSSSEVKSSKKDPTMDLTGPKRMPSMTGLALGTRSLSINLKLDRFQEQQEIH